MASDPLPTDHDVWARYHAGLKKAQTGCPDLNDLAGYVAHRLTAERTLQLEAHLLECNDCVEALEEARIAQRASEGAEAPKIHRRNALLGWIAVSAACVLVSACGFHIGATFLHERQATAAALSTDIRGRHAGPGTAELGGQE